MGLRDTRTQKKGWWEMAKKRRYKKRKKAASKLDLAVVTMIVFSLLLAVLIYTKSGVIGLKLNEILRKNVWNYAICSSNRHFCTCY